MEEVALANSDKCKHQKVARISMQSVLLIALQLDKGTNISDTTGTSKPTPTVHVLGNEQM